MICEIPEADSFTEDELEQATKNLTQLACLLMDPGQQMAVDDWAETYLDLPGRNNRYAGRISLDRTPYMRGPLRAYSQSLWRRHVLIWGTQVGKTLVLQIIMAYVIDRDPGPMMIIYPDRGTAKRRSKKHLLQLIEDNDVLKKHATGRRQDLQLFEYTMDRMTINVAWSGSPSLLASESIMHLIRDEYAKMKHRDKSEAHPMDLSYRRVIAYSPLERVVDATTPTLKGDYGDKCLREGTWHEFWVPCPHCGRPDLVEDVPDPVLDPRKHVPQEDQITFDRAGESLRARMTAAGYQVLEWDNITWDKTIKDLDLQAETAHYVCPHCAGRVDHVQVHPMTLKGKWIPRHPERSYASWHLPCWYRETGETNFPMVVKRWLRAQGDPKAIQDCLNGDRAIGYEEIGTSKTQEEIRANCCRAYSTRLIPFTPLFVFMTVDLRAPEIHFVVRAWTYYESSALVRYGVLARMKTFRDGDKPTGESLAVLDQLLDLTYKSADGQEYPINLVGIDSGFNTDEVYAYCRTRARCVAMKSEDLTQVLKFSQPEMDPITRLPRMDSCHLISWQHDYFADLLYGRMGVGRDLPGEWMLPADVGDEFLVHMISEKRVDVPSRWGRSKSRWRTLNKRNHWLDCEREQFVLARMVNLADKTPAAAPVQAPQPSGGSSFMGRDISGFSDRFGR